jgi:hypothetical protein
MSYECPPKKTPQHQSESDTEVASGNIIINDTRTTVDNNENKDETPD